MDELDPVAFKKASIQSITQNLDPYTVFMVEDEQHQINVLSKGKYGGVGIQLGYRNKTMSVVAPMDGGPAKKAGIISGDVILKVNDEDVKKMNALYATKAGQNMFKPDALSEGDKVVLKEFYASETGQKIVNSQDSMNASMSNISEMWSKDLYQAVISKLSEKGYNL